MQISPYIKILRTNQWVKNLLIFFPAIFGKTLFNVGVISDLSITFLSFSLLASSVYIFNDIQDKAPDSNHPKKKFKPLPLNLILIKWAYLYAAVLFTISSVLILSINYTGILFHLIYLLVNISYSLGLKNIPILDILLITSGFLIRIFLGGFIAEVHVSYWLITMTALMSLLILLAKRKDEINFINEHSRKVMFFYKKLNFKFTLHALAALNLITYIIYTIQPYTRDLFNSNKIWFTSAFAGIGLFSFVNAVVNTNQPFEPITLIFKNKLILISLVAWSVSFFVIIYG